jgi:NitT/TauT family transport system substrate-binding protein
MTRRRIGSSVIVAAGLAVTLASGCSADDRSDRATAPSIAPSSATSSVASTPAAAGCVNGLTDPADMRPERSIARCELGAPAPRPLEKTEKVVVSTAFRLEFVAPLLVGDAFGEFAKENLDVEIVALGFSDAVPQLVSERVDVAVGGMEVALFSAGQKQLPVRAVLGATVAPHAGDYTRAQAGLWCRRDAFRDRANPDLKQIERLRLASASGLASASTYSIVSEIRRRGITDFDISKAEVSRVPSIDIPAALTSRQTDCGLLLDPLWLLVKNNPDFFLAATQAPIESFAMYAFGRRLLEKRRDVGEAFARAYIRTVNTYFRGDYHQDREVMAAIAKATAQPIETYAALDSLLIDWELREGTTTRVQQLFIELGVITEYRDPVPESRIVDRSFYQKAVGAPA